MQPISMEFCTVLNQRADSLVERSGAVGTPIARREVRLILPLNQRNEAGDSPLRTCRFQTILSMEQNAMIAEVGRSSRLLAHSTPVVMRITIHFACTNHTFPPSME